MRIGFLCNWQLGVKKKKKNAVLSSQKQTGLLKVKIVFCFFRRGLLPAVAYIALIGRNKSSLGSHRALLKGHIYSKYKFKPKFLYSKLS